jgi:hypothetical protein
MYHLSFKDNSLQFNDDLKTRKTDVQSEISKASEIIIPLSMD